MEVLQLPEKKPKKIIQSISWNPDTWKRLERFSKKNKRSRSEIADYAVNRLIDEAEQYDQTKEVEGG